MLSLISHDVRSPLNSLQATLGLLDTHALTTAETASLLAKLAHKVQHTSLFLDNLLHWSRSQMEGLVVRPERLDLWRMAQQTCLLCGPLAEDKGVGLSNQITLPIDAYADAVMVQTVIRNLVSNAIKFCRSRDQVTLRAEQHIDEVWFAVQDTGIGIPPDQLATLFAPRSSGVLSLTTLGTQQEKGTGLGLRVCQEFVEKNGGRIWVESQSGIGSTFFFSLPRVIVVERDGPAEVPLVGV